jgi:hypothetical protein
MMPISNIVSGWLRHLVYGKCAKVDIPVNPHFGWRQHWKSKFKLNLHQCPIFAQALLDKTERIVYRVPRNGENERRQETEVIQLIETTATA